MSYFEVVLAQQFGITGVSEAKRAVYDGVLSHTSGPTFRGRCMSTAVVAIVSVLKRSAFETCRRELSEDVSFGIGTIATLVVVDKIGLGKRTQGGRD